MSSILTNVSIEVDDEAIEINPDSVTYNEGLGESTVTAGSKGGRPTTIVSTDETTRVGMIKFEMPATVKAQDLSRDFKARGDERVVKMSGMDSEGNRFGRTLRHGVMTPDSEKEVKNEGKIEIEFKGAPLVPS